MKKFLKGFGITLVKTGVIVVSAVGTITVLATAKENSHI